MVVPLAAVLAAAVPVVLLAVLVLRSHPLSASAWATAGGAAVLAATVFSLPPPGLAVAVARGLWTGGWILLIVLPALLLFEVLDRSGALDVLADAAATAAPTEGRRRLLVAWVLPSFLQGVAGFGTPIAMTAPMLVRHGMRPVAAVATCLAGYHWAVTFGSMGSSYFMAAATARLSADAAGVLAVRAGAILAVNAVVAGLVVLVRGRRSPGDLPRALALGALMGVALVATVSLQPALGSTVAGLAGLLAGWWVLPDGRGAAPVGWRLAAAALPYLVLVSGVTVALGVGPVRRALGGVPALAPVLPGTTAAFGHTTPRAAVAPAFDPLLHPLLYLVLAAAVGVGAYRALGWWPAGTTAAALRGWVGRSGSVTGAILGLTVVAALMVEAGMVAALAGALARGLGGLFLVASPLLGALGTVLTGSTTASNALFSALQADVAAQVGMSPATLVAAQTAGGNVGNALAPVNVAVGLAAVGVAGAEGRVVRRNLSASGVFLAVVVVAVLALAA